MRDCTFQLLPRQPLGFPRFISDHGLLYPMGSGVASCKWVTGAAVSFTPRVPPPSLESGVSRWLQPCPVLLTIDCMCLLSLDHLENTRRTVLEEASVCILRAPRSRDQDQGLPGFPRCPQHLPVPGMWWVLVTE